MKKPLLEFGYISRAHGMQGEVVVRTFDPTSSVFETVERLFIRHKDGSEKTYAIIDVREGSQGDLLVTLKGVKTREGAEALRGSTLFAYREELPTPEDGEYFQGDLIGLSVVTPEGVALGTIEELMNAGPVPNFVIRLGDKELMVPFAEEFVQSIDLKKGVVVLTPPQEP